MKVRLHAVVGEKLVRVETDAGLWLDVAASGELWDAVRLLQALGSVECLRETRVVIRKHPDPLVGWTLGRILKQKPAPAADN